MKPVLMKQPLGMGDIFFTIKIAESFKEKGHQVIHPVAKELDFFKDRLINDIEYVCVEDDFAHKNLYMKAPLGAITEYDTFNERKLDILQKKNNLGYEWSLQI